MKLKKFREYPFTAETEVKINDLWFTPISIEKTFLNVLDWQYNQIYIEIGKFSYSDIQALREKPKAPENPKKIPPLKNRSSFFSKDVQDILFDRCQVLTEAVNTILEGEK